MFRFLLLLLLSLVACKADPVPAAEDPELGQCSDDADNDADGLFDCRDPDCVTAEICQVQPGDDTATTPGPLTEAAYLSQAMTASCRVFVMCEFYSTVAECEAASQPVDTSNCEFNGTLAAQCLQEVNSINACPDPFEFPASCYDVFQCDTGF